MPLYDYKCLNCGYTMEAYATLEERDKMVHVCTKCGATMTRVFSFPSIVHRYNLDIPGGARAKKSSL